ncbi:uncharacterized protein B0T23DRAFT_324650, partial [Neurospora hispaniola]
RIQFPLVITYSITIHKVQNSTLDMAILNISKRDFQTGLTYIAYNRVKTLQSLIFNSPFDLNIL